MKKILLLALVMLTGTLYSRANVITFLNMTPCDYTYHVVFVDPANPTMMLASAAITVPPGTTAFPTPSTLPGVTGLPATVHYWGVRGWLNTPHMSANVGGAGTVLGFPTSVTLPSVPCRLAGPTTFFNGNTTGGNVVILIN